MNLKEKVTNAIAETAMSIPDLQKKFNVTNEYKIMRIIAELQYDKKAILYDFEKLYQPDGCAFYLARYRGQVVQ
jgi:hypothetical protein